MACRARASRTGRSPTRSSSRTTTQAEWEMGISGQRINSPFVAPMSKDYPVPPVPLKASGALFKMARRSRTGRRARAARDHLEAVQGRSACVNCGMCSGFGCHVKARSSSAVTMLPLAEKTGRCEIRVRSYVREISVDQQRPGDRRRVLRREQARSPPAGQGRDSVGQRHRDAAAAAAVEVGAVPRTAWRTPAVSSAGT